MSIKIQKLYAKLISVCLGICFTLVMLSPLGFAASESAIIVTGKQIGRAHV